MKKGLRPTPRALVQIVSFDGMRARRASASRVFGGKGAVMGYLSQDQGTQENARGARRKQE